MGQHQLILAMRYELTKRGEIHYKFNDYYKTLNEMENKLTVIIGDYYIYRHCSRRKCKKNRPLLIYFRNQEKNMRLYHDLRQDVGIFAAHLCHKTLESEF